MASRGWFCELDNEPSDAIKGGGFLDVLKVQCFAQYY